MMGVPSIGLPPLCTLRELQDGTYTLWDVDEMHNVMLAAIESVKPR